MKKIIFLVSLVFVLPLFAACTAQEKEKALSMIESENILQVDEDGNTTINKWILANLLNEASAAELSEEEKAGIEFMLEEEKLARDVYEKLFEKWGQQNFNNISQSEGTHIDAVRSLAEKYGVDVSFYDDNVGQFANSELQTLYNDLVSQGEGSLAEALKIGALIEEIDILDLEKYLENTDNADIKLVYENLMRGSRNHLRSFTRTMQRQGQDYEPQRLGKADYDKIVGSDIERGNSQAGGGQGQQNSGQGQGKNRR